MTADEKATLTRVVNGGHTMDVTITAEEFLRFLHWRLKSELLVPLVPLPEALSHFGTEPILVTTNDVGEGTLSTQGTSGPAQRPAGGPEGGETSPGRMVPRTVPR